MVRRSFWFLCGAVAGVSGWSWARRRMAGMREAMSPGALVRAVLHAATSTVRRVRGVIAAARADGSSSGTVAARTPTVPASRRHMAPRPRNTHG